MIKIILSVALLAFILTVIITRTARHTFNRKYLIPVFIGRFINSAWRKLLQPPDTLVKRTGFEDGMRVLEIGCGTGTYTLHACAALGNKGRLFVSDVQVGMLSFFKKKSAQEPDSETLMFSVADAHVLPFKLASFDLIFLVSVFPSLSDPKKALSECLRILKPDGRLSISEFLIDPDYISRQSVIHRCEAAGFTRAEVLGNFFNYTINFKKG